MLVTKLLLSSAPAFIVEALLSVFVASLSLALVLAEKGLRDVDEKANGLVDVGDGFEFWARLDVAKKGEVTFVLSCALMLFAAVLDPKLKLFVDEANVNGFAGFVFELFWSSLLLVSLLVLPTLTLAFVDVSEMEFVVFVVAVLLLLLLLLSVTVAAFDVAFAKLNGELVVLAVLNEVANGLAALLFTEVIMLMLLLLFLLSLVVNEGVVYAVRGANIVAVELFLLSCASLTLSFVGSGLAVC